MTGTTTMAKKPARKPSLTPAMQDQIRAEYGLGATVAELSRKYERGSSIISRLTNSVSRDGEQLANKLAEVRADIGTRPDNEQSLIIQRSEQIQKIKEVVLKGTNYIAGRALNKLNKLKDDKTSFNDLLQTQTIMSKAHAIVEPKALIENNTMNNTQVNLVVEFVEPD